MATSSYRYPDLSPVGSEADAGLEGLGINWNRGGEGLTPWVDYIKFQVYRPQYNGKAILESFKVDNKSGTTTQAGVDIGATVYLYMPTNIAVAYSASYNSTAFGVGGIAAAQMMSGGGSSEEVAKTLQNAAAGATPEAGFKAVADASNAISSFIGTSGQVTGSDLAAVSQGKIFNPYEEQIFNGITFRAHSFNFKLVARSAKEAGQIDAILKVLKFAMLPGYDSSMGDTTKIGNSAVDAGAGAKPAASVASKLGGGLSSQNRYLKVPSRVKVEFVRIGTVKGTLGAVGGAYPVRGLFKMKDCIIDGMQVNYTPDGAYANTNDGYVPALDLNLSLKEIALVTSDDIEGGF